MLWLWLLVGVAMLLVWLVLLRLWLSLPVRYISTLLLKYAALRTYCCCAWLY